LGLLSSSGAAAQRTILFIPVLHAPTCDLAGGPLREPPLFPSSVTAASSSLVLERLEPSDFEI
jgi:hypothetical protein